MRLPSLLDSKTLLDLLDSLGAITKIVGEISHIYEHTLGITRDPFNTTFGYNLNQIEELGLRKGSGVVVYQHNRTKKVIRVFSEDGEPLLLRYE